MKLKHTLTEAEFEKLGGERLASAYSKNEDGSGYTLDVEGSVDDISGLKSALVKERAARKEAERRAKSISEADQTQLSEQVSTLTAERDELQSRLTELDGKVTETEAARYRERFEGGFKLAALKADVKHEALDDAVGRALKRFRPGDDGTYQPHTDDGDLMYGPDAGKVLSHDEWLKLHLQVEAPHLFGTSNGYGSTTPGQAPSAFVISRADATDSRKWKAVQERAARAGTKVQMID